MSGLASSLPNHQLNKQTWVSNKTVDQNRAFLVVNILISTSNTLSVGYLNQYDIKSTANQMNNIIFIGFNLTDKAIFLPCANIIKPKQSSCWSNKLIFYYSEFSAIYYINYSLIGKIIAQS